MAMNTRIEHDTMGEIAVPADCFWGAQTQRSVQNFPIGTERQPKEIITAFAYLKEACAKANRDVGKLTDAQAGAITAACEEKGLTYVWLNARRDESDNWVNADGELAAYFFAWGDGEPSRVDSGDGAAEDYFLLWNMGGRWSGNDSREDPLDGYWTAYTGKIGFVCKTVSYPLADETADTAAQSGQEG